MEPITLITTALVAGAAAAGTDVGGMALKDAYGALKQFIVDRYEKVRPAVEMVENNPAEAAFGTAAAAALKNAGAADDAELLDLARNLNALLEEQEKAAPGSTIINVSGSGAAAVSGGVAAGAGGIAVGGSVKGEVGTANAPEDEA